MIYCMSKFLLFFILTWKMSLSYPHVLANPNNKLDHSQRTICSIYCKLSNLVVCYPQNPNPKSNELTRTYKYHHACKDVKDSGWAI